MLDLALHSERMADTQIPPDSVPAGLVVAVRLSLDLEPAVAMVDPLGAACTHLSDPNSAMLDWMDCPRLDGLAVTAKGDQMNAETTGGCAVPDSIAAGFRQALVVVVVMDDSMSRWQKKAKLDKMEVGGIALHSGCGSVDVSRSPTRMNLTTLASRLAADSNCWSPRLVSMLLWQQDLVVMVEIETVLTDLSRELEGLPISQPVAGEKDLSRLLLLPLLRS